MLETLTIVITTTVTPPKPVQEPKQDCTVLQAIVNSPNFKNQDDEVKDYFINKLNQCKELSND